MQIKGILFDFDGTIANTIELIIATFEHTCQEVLSFTPEREKIVATFGLPLPEAMIALSGKPELVETMRDAYREYNNAHHDDMIRPIPGVQKTLEQLKAQGIKLAVVTSKKPPMLRRGMDCLQLTQYFDATVALGDTKENKPHPEPMLAACAKLGLQPVRRRQSLRFAERTQCGGENRCRALYGLCLGEAGGRGQTRFCDCKTGGAAGDSGEI